MIERPSFYALGRRFAMHPWSFDPAVGFAVDMWIKMVHPRERNSRAKVWLS